jgi:hypothetical protein
LDPALNKKSPIASNRTIWPYVIFSSVLEILPIKDALFLSALIFLGVDISLFSNATQGKSQEKNPSHFCADLV